MSAAQRLDQIVTLVQERGFVSVRELGQLCAVSEVTIRRDLQLLHDEGRLQRTYGGAASARSSAELGSGSGLTPDASGFLTDRVDVLVAAAADPQFERLLYDQAQRKHIPIVAESLGMMGMTTLVALDNHLAGCDLGRWAGCYALEHFGGQARVLDLGHTLSNTAARSRGFLAGLREVVPGAELLLSINAQSRFQTAYQLASDALRVYPGINIIFAINDTTAWGAHEACRDLGVDPASLLLVTFGLEGDTLRTILSETDYCRAGLAMFPEIVGPVCIEAALRAHRGDTLPAHLVTPHAVLTPESLHEYYVKTETGWRLQWDTVQERLTVPLRPAGLLPATAPNRPRAPLPRRIAFVVPYSEHEWYRNLEAAMQEHTLRLGIELEIVDAEQNLRDEMDLRRRGIAVAAAELVEPGDVILIDGGQVTTCLAEELAHKHGFTVITNSVRVFDALRNCPDVTLISTGGLLRHESGTLIGPTAEAVLRDLRADRLFLAVSGASLAFGLSHTNLAEVTMKQAMIRAAREVILLADHTKFEQEAVVQIAPLSAVNRLVTDSALPASLRLELSKLGLHIIVAQT